MKVYAFDVDETLECSHGPITMTMVKELREQGHIMAICGNWAVLAAVVKDWHKTFSFIGPMGMLKVEFLREIKRWQDAEEYIMVGNIKGVSGNSDDFGAALRAEWRFIREADFAKGAR